MSADTSGLEVLRRAGETDGSLPELRHKVRVVSSALPAGAATEATLSELNQKLSSDTATVTAVAGSTSAVTVLAANASRKGFLLYNNTNRDALIKYGTSASTTSFTFIIAPGGNDQNRLTNYRGIITAIWGAGVSGDLLVTELT